MNYLITSIFFFFNVEKPSEAQHQNVVLINYPNQQLDTNPPAYHELVRQPKVVHIYTKQDDHLALSIFNLLCCTICLGIPALIFSIRAREQYRLGRTLEATDNAKTAYKLNIAGITIGILLLIFLFVTKTFFRSY